MTIPDPESSDPKPRPKGPRLKIDRLTKDQSEKDLWDFEPIETPPAAPVEPPPAPIEKSGLPKPRSKAPAAIERSPRPLPASEEGGEDTVRKSAIVRRGPKNSDPVRRPAQFDDIGELEGSENEWAEPPSMPLGPEPPDTAEAELSGESEATTPDGAPSETKETVLPEEDSEAPGINAGPLPVQLGLTKLEKAGLAGLVVALLATGLFLFFSTFKHVSTRSDRDERPSFPIKGNQVRILDADSYWREPAKSGSGAEVVRRETKLIPVLTLELEGGPCAIRAIFRNELGESVGDSVTRAASSGKLEIPATAGFEDLGAHAAYRTGETRPWKIEIFEAPSVDSPRQEFKKLLELPISTDRR